MSKGTAHILEIGHQSFAIESAAAATKLIDLLSKLQPVAYNHCSGDNWRESHYFPKGEPLRIRLEMNQPFRKRKADLALPRPKRGSTRCACGHSDVAPGERCASCGAIKA